MEKLSEVSSTLYTYSSSTADVMFVSYIILNVNGTGYMYVASLFFFFYSDVVYERKICYHQSCNVGNVNIIYSLVVCAIEPLLLNGLKMQCMRRILNRKIWFETFHVILDFCSRSNFYYFPMILSSKWGFYFSFSFSSFFVPLVLLFSHSLTIHDNHLIL